MIYCLLYRAPIKDLGQVVRMQQQEPNSPNLAKALLTYSDSTSLQHSRNHMQAINRHPVLFSSVFAGLRLPSTSTSASASSSFALISLTADAWAVHALMHERLWAELASFQNSAARVNVNISWASNGTEWQSLKKWLQLQVSAQPKVKTTDCRVQGCT